MTEPTIPHPQGLTTAAAASLLTEHGPNTVRRESAASPFALLLRQFKSPVVWLLLAAATIASALGELADAIAIGTIVNVNALVGFFRNTERSARCWPYAP